MKRRTYKKGPSDEHARKMLVKEREREKNKVEIEKPLFRGFLAADGFITSKGSRGTKLDSMWSKHMIEAFPIDDDELLKIAMESCLFDIHAQVVGGEFGTPFSIGDYGFYAKNQFEAQRAVLDAVEREHCIGMFLSEGEWEKVNVKLYEIACFSYSKLDLAVRGDTILNIAIRDNAYKSAKILLDGGIDPLIENEEGSDLVHIIQQQYGAMSLRLSDLQAAKDRSKKKVLIPSEEKEIRDREKNTLDSLEHMVIFINALEDNLKARVKSIEDDKWTVKVATLRKQIDTVPYEVTWNASKGDIVQSHLVECEQIKEYIKDKIERYRTSTTGHVSLSSIMHLKNRMLVHKRSNEEAMLRKQISSAEASKMELEKVSSSEDLNVISFSNTNDSINLQTSNTSKTDIALFDESNDNNKLDNVLNSGVNSKKCSPRKKNSRNNSKNNSKKSTPRMRTISAPESVDPISEHTGLTAEEEAHLQEHAPLLLQAHQKKVFSKEEMEKMGGVQLNSDEDISWVQIGDSFHMMKVPKRNRPKSDDKPILGIMYQSDTEVVHYK